MYWFLGAVIVIYLIYRQLSNGIRKATKIIGYQINVKPTLVTECISRMRTDPNMALGKMSRQEFFCHLVVSAHGNQSKLSDPIKVFYMYQILKNPHEDYVSWWADKLSSAGFDINISLAEKQLFLTFFDVDLEVLKEVINEHNTKFI